MYFCVRRRCIRPQARAPADGTAPADIYASALELPRWLSRNSDGTAELAAELRSEVRFPGVSLNQVV